MKGFFVHDHFGPLNAFVVAKLARKFESSFVSLKASRAKKYVLKAGQLHQLGRQRFLQRHVVVVRAVNQLGKLVLQRRH